MKYDRHMTILLRGWMKDEDSPGEPSCYFVLLRETGNTGRPLVRDHYSLCANYIMARVDLLRRTCRERCARCDELRKTCRTEADYRRLEVQAGVTFEKAVAQLMRRDEIRQQGKNRRARSPRSAR